MGSRHNPILTTTEEVAGARLATSGLPVVYQLRLWLRRISPMIWRCVLVRSDSTIADLHYTIQIVMGWTDTHLHRFRIHGKDYGVAHPGGITFAYPDELVSLSDFRFRPRERFLYKYDFHDLWQHEIQVEQLLSLEAKRSYPLCIAGHRAGPPEDCGGPRAFFELSQDVPGEAYQCLVQLAENIEVRDVEAVRNQLLHLESLRPW